MATTPGQLYRLSQPQQIATAAALLAVLTALTFRRICDFQFVSWDDPLHVGGNPYFNPPTAVHLAHFWLKPYGQLYIPVAYMAYAVLVRLAMASSGALGAADSGPLVFHTASLILHVSNALLVFGVLRRLFASSSPWTWLAGAVVFAAHPVQAESVAWVSELRGLIAGAFALGSLTLYMDGVSTTTKRPGLARAGSAVLFLLAALSKPSAIAVLPMAAIVGWLLTRQAAGSLSEKGAVFWPPLLMPLIPAAAIAVVVVAIGCVAQPSPPALQIPFWQRPLVAGDALAFYFAQLIWPANLAIDYGLTPHAVMTSWQGRVEWIGPVALAALLWHGRRRRPEPAAAALLFTAALLPNLGFVPFLFQAVSTTADRYLYLAMLGPCVAITWLTSILLTLPIRVRAPMTVVGAGLAASLMACTAAQSETWRNSAALLARAIAVNPSSAVALNNMGRWYEDRGDTRAASAYYRSAVAADGAFGLGYSNLGRLTEARGDVDGAMRLYEAALAHDPRCAHAELHLASLLARQGDYAYALPHARTAVALMPDSAESRALVDEVVQHIRARSSAKLEPNWVRSY